MANLLYGRSWNNFSVLNKQIKIIEQGLVLLSQRAIQHVLLKYKINHSCQYVYVRKINKNAYSFILLTSCTSCTNRI